MKFPTCKAMPRKRLNGTLVRTSSAASSRLWQRRVMLLYTSSCVNESFVSLNLPGLKLHSGIIFCSTSRNVSTLCSCPCNLIFSSVLGIAAASSSISSNDSRESLTSMEVTNLHKSIIGILILLMAIPMACARFVSNTAIPMGLMVSGLFRPDSSFLNMAVKRFLSNAGSLSPDASVPKTVLPIASLSWYTGLTQWIFRPKGDTEGFRASSSVSLPVLTPVFAFAFATAFALPNTIALGGCGGFPLACALAGGPLKHVLDAALSLRFCIMSHVSRAGYNEKATAMKLAATAASARKLCDNVPRRASSTAAPRSLLQGLSSSISRERWWSAARTRSLSQFNKNSVTIPETTPTLSTLTWDGDEMVLRRDFGCSRDSVPPAPLQSR
mmetsp:Transcript_112834/g.224486  ORF Transcript_112834/g.224486 Transcript_112834/m.224486 type:complete len:384 (+) Transcript_112834:1222-2373(+)